MDMNQIMELIPERPPFLLLDRMTALVPGYSAVGLKNVTGSDWFFNGHYPGASVMPGVLIAEAMAQLGKCILLSQPGFEQKTVLLGAVEKARFRQNVVPGDALTFEVEITKQRLSAAFARGYAYVDGAKVCDASFTFIIK